MFRRTFGVGRSSQPKRPSIPPTENAEVPLERNLVLSAAGTRTSRMSKIPRPRNVSAERESGTGERRGRSQSSERNRSSRRPQSFGFGTKLKALSTENLFQTPSSRFKNVNETPASTVARMLCSSKKQLKKDSRPLHDKQYQNLQLQKVRAYLVAHNMASEAEELATKSVTKKSFVNIMSCLLERTFSNQQITTANYPEILPVLMKRLKYPGNAQRSVIVSANSPLSWPIVLGMMSWLVNRISVNMSFKEMPDEYWSPQEFEEMLAYNRESYHRWVYEDNTPVVDCTEREKLFLKELVSRKMESVEQTIGKYNEEIEKCLKQISSPGDVAADENLKMEKITLENLKAEMEDLTLELRTLQAAYDKFSRERTVLKETLSKVALQKNCVTEKHKTFSGRKWSNENPTQQTEECIYLESVTSSLKNQIQNMKKEDYMQDLELSNVMRQEVALQHDVRVLLEGFPDVVGLAEQAMQLPATDKRRLLQEELERHYQLLEEAVVTIRKGMLALHTTEQATLATKGEKEKAAALQEKDLWSNTLSRIKRRNAKLQQLKTELADGKKLLKSVLDGEPVEEDSSDDLSERLLTTKETYKIHQEKMKNQEKELKDDMKSVLKVFSDHLDARDNIRAMAREKALQKHGL